MATQMVTSWFSDSHGDGVATPTSQLWTLQYTTCWLETWSSIREGKNILGACSIKKPRQERKWFAKIPDFKAPDAATSFHCPALGLVDEGTHESNDYMEDPTNLVFCLADVTPGNVPYDRNVEPECTHGGTRFESRIAVGFRMHPTAAFLSMPNDCGVITGGTTSRGFHDHSERGYPLFLNLSTQQVSDVVRYDEKILEENALLTCLKMRILVIARRQSDKSVLDTILKGIRKQLWWIPWGSTCATSHRWPSYDHNVVLIKAGCHVKVEPNQDVAVEGPVARWWLEVELPEHGQDALWLFVLDFASVDIYSPKGCCDGQGFILSLVHIQAMWCALQREICALLD